MRKGANPSGHFIKHRAEREDVASGVHRFSLHVPRDAFVLADEKSFLGEPVTLSVVRADDAADLVGVIE